MTASKGWDSFVESHSVLVQLIYTLINNDYCDSKMNQLQQ